MIIYNHIDIKTHMAINMWQWYPSAIKCMSVDDWILGVYWKYVGFFSRLIENCLVGGHAIVRNDRWLWNLLLVGNRNAWLYMAISCYFNEKFQWKHAWIEKGNRSAGVQVPGLWILKRSLNHSNWLVRHVRHVRPGLPKPLPKQSRQSVQSLRILFVPCRQCRQCRAEWIAEWIAEFAVCSSVWSKHGKSHCQAIRFHLLSLKAKRSVLKESSIVRFLCGHCNTLHLWHLVTSCVFEKCDECDEKCDHNVTISMWQCDPKGWP